MKLRNKTLLAAAILVAAGSANATLTSGSTTGTNSAYLVAFDANYVNTDGSLGRSFNLDLGTTFAALQAGTGSALSAFAGTGLNLSTDANWTAFTTLGAGETAQSITYGIYAAGDTFSQPNNGVFLSGLTTPTAPLPTARTNPPGSTTTWLGPHIAINQHAAEINNGLAAGANSSVILATDATSSGQADSVPNFNNVWGQGLNNFDPTAAYGSATGFWYGGTHLGSVQARAGGPITQGVALLAQTDIVNVGQFTLAGNSLSYVPASVPLPAAVWMFGAGLMGMLRLNRRKSVQA